MISQKARYALRALIALARADSMMIAEKQQIPRKFLEQILLDLKHQGIVASRRGRMGGMGCSYRQTRLPLGGFSGLLMARSRRSLA